MKYKENVANYHKYLVMRNGLGKNYPIMILGCVNDFFWHAKFSGIYTWWWIKCWKAGYMSRQAIYVSFKNVNTMKSCQKFKDPLRDPDQQTVLEIFQRMMIKTCPIQAYLTEEKLLVSISFQRQCWQLICRCSFKNPATILMRWRICYASTQFKQHLIAPIQFSIVHSNSLLQ